MKYVIAIISILLITTVSLINSFGRSPAQTTNQQFVLTFSNFHQIDNQFFFTKDIYVWKDNIISLFWDDTFEDITLKKDEIHQAVSVQSKGKYVVMRHYVNFLDYNEYVFRNTDSVLIRYQNGLPHITVLNRLSSEHDYDFDNLVRNDSKANQYTVLGKYLGAIHIFGQRTLSNKNQPKLTSEQLFFRNKKGVESVKKELYSDCKVYLKQMRVILDSLKNNSLISEVPYEFYNHKITQLDLLLEMESGKLTVQQMSHYSKNFHNSRYGYPEIYYRDLIKTLADTYIVDKATYVPLQDGVNRDQKEVYDQLVTSTIFSDTDRNYLLTRQIHRIAHYYSSDDFRTYFRKYEQDVKDTALVNTLRRTYALEFETSRNTTQSVVLADMQGNQLTLDDLKKRHAGKVLYVDFWASWCAPCRQAFPHSVALREQLKDSNVVFIYLSIDQTVKPWQVASQKEKLDTYMDSYLIINHKTSDFVKQQKIEAIPRYMIFDKQGILTHSNAPRVENKDLKNILIKLAN
jgi:thiol-disulfide isomerase/thioredoxin